MGIFKYLFVLFSITSLFASTPIIELENRITDKSNTLSANEITSLEQKLKNSQIAVLILDKIEGYTIEEYAIEVATLNKLGKKDIDDGLLLLFDIQNRGVRIEVGYGLEGVITDLVASRIIREQIVPNFKEKNYYQGISLAIDAINSYSNSASANETDTQNIQTKSKNSTDYIPILFSIPILVAIVISVLLSQMIKKYQFPFKKYSAFYYASLFVIFIAFIFLIDIKLDVVLFLIIILSSIAVGYPLLYILPLLFSLIIGNKEQTKFVWYIRDLKKRNGKITKTLDAFSSRYELDKYHFSFFLKKYFDTFNKFQTNITTIYFIQAEFTNCDDTQLLNTNLFNKDGKQTYQIVGICYKENQYPTIKVIESDDSNILHIKEISYIDELKPEIKKEDGLWKSIRFLPLFKEGEQTSSSSSNGSKSGFSGGGGKFGGGGSSGKW